MNREGPEWCETHEDELIDEMEHNSKELTVWRQLIAAALLTAKEPVLAIRLAKCTTDRERIGVILREAIARAKSKE